MAERLSRRKLAAYTAEQLIRQRPASEVFIELAAYLLDTRRTREAELLVRDIEDYLAARGIVVADIVTATALSDRLRAQITSLIGADHVHMRETVDASIIGGVRIDIPGKRLDATIRRRLQTLKAQKV